ncbi:MAG: alanine racemase [Firmicutes bacterium]|nr:alanine racemase [Bacillota bacterium]
MSRYQELIRPVWVDIDLGAIRHNLTEIRRQIGPTVEVMAVVKAEAYGHGAIKVAKTLLQAGANRLGVALTEEGIALREAGITAPILVFSPLQVEQGNMMVKYDLTPTICMLEPAVALSRAAVKAGKVINIHLKIDTGMGRIGVPANEGIIFIKKLQSLPGITLEGLFSHLATADEQDKDYAKYQIKTFNKVIVDLKNEGLLPAKIHLANSAAIIDLPLTHYNMVRPGIMLYGMYPSLEVDLKKVRLKPAFALKTKVVFVKRVASGITISYGRKFTAPKDTTIITIPLGYADGWPRRLMGKAEVLISGKRFPIVGTICMDFCMVDVGDEPVEIGQEVVLIGSQGTESISVDNIANHLETINYEVTCMISDRVPRRYINEN